MFGALPVIDDGRVPSGEGGGGRDLANFKVGRYYSNDLGPIPYVLVTESIAL